VIAAASRAYTTANRENLATYTLPYLLIARRGEVRDEEILVDAIWRGAVAVAAQVRKPSSHFMFEIRELQRAQDHEQKKLVSSSLRYPCGRGLCRAAHSASFDVENQRKAYLVTRSKQGKAA
jgi:hypothetical protein